MSIESIVPNLATKAKVSVVSFYKRYCFILWICIPALVFSGLFTDAFSQFWKYPIESRLFPSFIRFASISGIIRFIFWSGILLFALRSRLIAYGLIPTIFLYNLIWLYIKTKTYVEFDALIISTLNTTAKEASQFIFPSQIIFLFFSISILYVYLTRLRTYLSYRAKRFHLILASILVLLSTLFPHIIRYSGGGIYLLEHQADFLRNDMKNWNVTEERFLTSRIHSGELEKSYSPLSLERDLFICLNNYLFPEDEEDVTAKESTDRWDRENLIVCFVIGESIRPDHASLNGYARNTTPFLAECKNIISLPNMRSGATYTLGSIPLFFSGSLPDAKKLKGSFVHLFMKHNFVGKLVVSQNTEGEWYKTPRICRQLGGIHSTLERPLSTEDYFSVISTWISKHPRSLIILEDGTGHSPYECEYKPFGEGTSIDKYDNCIYSADKHLESVIKALRDTNAVLIYASDHGESFGENNYVGHGSMDDVPEQKKVLSFIWYSDKYSQKHPEIVAALEKNSKKFDHYTKIYDTILSLGGIKSEIQDISRDMTKDR